MTSQTGEHLLCASSYSVIEVVKAVPRLPCRFLRVDRFDTADKWFSADSFEKVCLFICIKSVQGSLYEAFESGHMFTSQLVRLCKQPDVQAKQPLHIAYFQNNDRKIPQEASRETLFS